MNFYVITDKQSGVNEIDSPVFELKDSGGQSAVMVFLTLDNVRQYIQDAGWAESQAVAELEPTQLLKWLTVAQREGIAGCVVDPQQAAHADQRPLRVLPLTNALETHADLLRIASELAYAQ